MTIKFRIKHTLGMLRMFLKTHDIVWMKAAIRLWNL